MIRHPTRTARRGTSCAALSNCSALTDFFFCSEEESDEEDDTAMLLRELEKIKRERAQEQERLEHEKSASEAAQRESEIATSNPLLNLAAALGQKPAGINTNAPGTFAVKRRWDDGEHHASRP